MTRLGPITIRKPNGDPIFSIRQTPKFLGGCRIAIHSFVAGDDIECFHDHPAWAFRLVLWGGYVEECREEEPHSDYVGERRWYRTWFPGRFGIIRPSFEHRIDRLLGKRSISLWFRGPVISPINTRGC